MNQLFWYRPLFMLQLLTAENIFALKLPKRSHFAFRSAGALAFCFGASFAVPLFPEVSYTTWYVAGMFFLLFLVSVAALFFVYKGSFKDVIFCAVAGYTVQHIASEIYETVNIVCGLNGELVSDLYQQQAIVSPGMACFVGIIYGFVYFAVYFAAVFFFAPMMEEDGALRMKNSYMLVLSGIIILVDIIFSSAVTYAVAPDADFMLVILVHLYNILCCFLVMILLFELPRRMNAEAELVTERRIHYREKQQYFQVKENIDLINRKCHDLKYEIRRLAQSKDLAEEWVEEAERGISVYESTYKTENEALDVILTEKSLLCRNLHIELSCIAEGEKLGFMKDTDVYALFGNMLDNAVEAASKCAEKRRRIGLSVKSVHRFLIIHVRNPYDDTIRFEDGLPVTSKADKDFHGFGMKSIRHVVEKYEGEMTINVENREFNLNIAFPLP